MELHSYLSEKQRSRRKRRGYLLLGLGALIVYAAAMSVAWFLLRAPFLNVQAINVEGNSMVSSDAVTAILQSAALRDHSFFKSLLGFRNMLTWPDSLSPADLAFDPRLESVTVAKDYFSHAITVNVQERTAAGIWCFMAPGPESGDCYWFDHDGFVFSRALDVEGGPLLAVHDESQAPQGLGKEILPSPFVPNLVSILNVLRASGIAVQSITLHDISLQEVAVATGATVAGPTLYFSLRFPADEDLAVLEQLMAKPGFAKIAYIDFRVQNRAYYR